MSLNQFPTFLMRLLVGLANEIASVNYILIFFAVNFIQDIIFAKLLD